MPAVPQVVGVFRDLEMEGFSDEVVSAVELKTHRDGESYEECVERANTHPVARRVRLADLEDTMNLLRIRNSEPKDAERLERHHRAWWRVSA